MTSSVGGLLVALVVAALTASIGRPSPRRPDPRHPATAVRRRGRHGEWHLAAWGRTIATGRSRREPAPRAVSAWCDDLARAIRAGSTFRDALRSVVPGDAATARATEPVRHRLERGATIVEAVDGTDGGPHLQLAVNVVAIAGRLGGSPAIAIERTAGALRQRGADREERSVQAAQARLSAHVLTAVPVAMLGLLCLLDPDVLAAATSSTGATSIGLGLAINALGWGWMRRIVGRSG